MSAPSASFKKNEQNCAQIAPETPDYRFDGLQSHVIITAKKFGFDQFLAQKLKDCFVTHMWHQTLSTTSHGCQIKGKARAKQQPPLLEYKLIKRRATSARIQIQKS